MSYFYQPFLESDEYGRELFEAHTTVADAEQVANLLRSKADEFSRSDGIERRVGIEIVAEEREI